MTHITLPRAVIEQALILFGNGNIDYQAFERTVTALRSALESAESVEQEPVAWADMEVRGEDKGLSWTPGWFHTTPLFTCSKVGGQWLEKKYAEFQSVLSGHAELKQQRDEFEEQRDAAWAELRKIRVAIGANMEESTADKAERIKRERDELLATLKALVRYVNNFNDDSLELNRARSVIKKVKEQRT